MVVVCICVPSDYTWFNEGLTTIIISEISGQFVALDGQRVLVVVVLWKGDTLCLRLCFGWQRIRR